MSIYFIILAFFWGAAGLVGLLLSDIFLRADTIFLYFCVCFHCFSPLAGLIFLRELMSPTDQRPVRDNNSLKKYKLPPKLEVLIGISVVASVAAPPGPSGPLRTFLEADKVCTLKQ